MVQKNIQKHILKFLLCMVIILMPTVGQSGAYFSDEETVTNITISTGTWNIEPTPTPTPVPSIDGSVVINEVMWMGTSVSGGDDEWVELRNTTNKDIVLDGWTINLKTGGKDLNLSGIIPALGFYLITEKPSNESAINNNIVPNLLSDKPIALPDEGRQLILKNSENIIDQTPIGAWPEGIHDGDIRKSMERNDTPGDGTSAGSWHTCVDTHCNDVDYWDTEGNNYGTPKSANLSENDPSNQTNLNFYFMNDKKYVGFKVSGLDPNTYSNLDYLITYDSDQTKQAITGTKNISSETEIIENDLILGWCSSGGTCVYNSGVSTVKIEITLHGATDEILTSEISK